MRIVALSDQHGFRPDVPTCDLLIIAGDVCPDRFGPFIAVHAPYQQQAWFDRTVRPWLAATPATHKLLTWGNHDWCGQMCSFRSDTPGHARSTDRQILLRRAGWRLSKRSQKWKRLRRTKHDHHPVHDALGNAEALIRLLDGER
jgi:hypothetical protein